MSQGRGDHLWRIGTQFRMETTKFSVPRREGYKAINYFPWCDSQLNESQSTCFFTKYYVSDKDLALNPLESTPPSMQVVWPSTFNVLTVIILLLTLVVVKNVNDVFLGAFARATVSEF